MTVEISWQQTEAFDVAEDVSLSPGSVLLSVHWGLGLYAFSDGAKVFIASLGSSEKAPLEISIDEKEHGRITGVAWSQAACVSSPMLAVCTDKGSLTLVYSVVITASGRAAAALPLKGASVEVESSTDMKIIACVWSPEVDGILAFATASDVFVSNIHDIFVTK